MKKILFYVLSLSFLISTTPAFAENLTIPTGGSPERIDIREVKGKILNDKDLFGIRMSEPVFKDRVYNQGDIVNIVIPMSNKTSVDYSDISISAFLMTSKDGSPSQEYGYQKNIAEVFLPKNSSKEIKIKFKMPDSASANIDTARIEFIAILKTGEVLGSTGRNIKLGAFLDSAVVNYAFLKVMDTEYTLQQGPTVAKNTAPKIIFELQNNSSANLDLIPKLKVYDMAPSRPEVGNKEYDMFTIKAGEKKELILDLKDFSKAGVYDGQLYFLDSNGKERAPFISSRWIVEGAMATIPNVNINQSKFKQGEMAVVNVEYTGSPVNIETGLSEDIGTSTIKMTLTNEKNEVIASSQKDIDLNTLSSIVNFELPVSFDADSVSVEVVITKGNAELAKYNTVLTDTAPKMGMGFIQYLILGLIVVFAIGAIYLRRKKSVLIPIAIFMLVLGFSTSEVHAARITPDFAKVPICSGGQCTNPGQFNLSTSLAKSVFLPGENMGNDIYSQGMAQVCHNSTLWTHVDYGIYKEDGTLVSSVSAFNSAAGSGDHRQNSYYKFASFTPTSANRTSTKVFAPMEPGKYILRTNSNAFYHSNVTRFGGIKGNQAGPPLNVTYGSFFKCTTAYEGESGFGKRGSPTLVLDENPTSIFYSGIIRSKNNMYRCYGPGKPVSSPMVNYFEFTVGPSDVSKEGDPALVASADELAEYSARVKWDYTDTKPQKKYKIEVSKYDTFPSNPFNLDGTMVIEEDVVASVNRSTFIARIYSAISMLKNLASTGSADAVRSTVSKNRTVSGLSPNTYYNLRVSVYNGEVWTVGKSSFTTAKPLGCDLLSDPSCDPTVIGDNDFACIAKPNPVTQGDNVILEVIKSSAASSGVLSYQWMENNSPILGATDPTYTRKYDTIGNYNLSVSIKTSSSTITENCHVSVQTSCGVKPGQKCNRITGRVQTPNKCDTTTSNWSWVDTTEVCGGPLINTFKFNPNNTNIGGKCKLYLEAENVKSCYLKNKTGQISLTEQVASSDNKISIAGNLEVSVGRHSLWCKGIYDDSIDVEYDKKRECFSSSEFTED